MTSTTAIAIAADMSKLRGRFWKMKTVLVCQLK